MSYFVYILLSLKDKGLYIGCTSNLERRVRRHNSGFVFATQNRVPLVLIYNEQFENKGEAFNRERFLKSLWGARFKKQILKDYLNKIGHISK